MYPLYLHFAIVLELERELERKELQRRSKYRESLWTIEQSRSRDELGRKVAHWFGTQMISWGAKLQNINTVPPADIVVDTKLSR